MVDDLLIYNGILDKFSVKKGVINYRDIIFSEDENWKHQEKEGFVKYECINILFSLLNAFVTDKLLTDKRFCY